MIQKPLNWAKPATSVSIQVSILMEALSWAEVSFRTSFAYIVSNDKQDPFFYLLSS